MSGPRPAELATLWLTYFAVGVTVSVTLVERDVEGWLVIAAAVGIHSATGELAFVAVDDAGGPLVAAVVSGWLVAARFGVLAAAIGARITAGVRYRIAVAWNALDPNVAMASAEVDEAAVRRTYWRVTAVLLAGWWSGSVVGVLAGDVVENADRLGLDAVFPAALLAIVGGQLRNSPGLAAGLVGAVVTLALLPVLPAGVPILLSLVGVPVGLWVADRQSREGAP